VPAGALALLVSAIGDDAAVIGPRRPDALALDPPRPSVITESSRILKTTFMIKIITAAAPLLLGCGRAAGPAPAFDAGRPPLTVVTEDPSDQPLAGLDASDLVQFRDGDGLFDLPFRAADGLGPVYIRTSCSACHDKAGRGPGRVHKFQVVDPAGNPLADAPELRWGNTERPYVSGGGHTPIVEPTMVSGAGRLVSTVRVGPSVLGRGYMEAITDAEIERVAAEQAARGDAIHGRINRVVHHSEQSALAASPHARGQDDLIGRFGLKARVVSLDDFSADAFQGDMGLTSPLRPLEVPNPDGLVDDLKAGPDLPAETVTTVARYVRMLAIPARDPAILAGPGRALFESARCAVCHVPALRTRADFPVAPLANIDAPVFTDLLLHDMGERLADELHDEGATGREWRTAPLIGLRFQRGFLHDGRAVTIEEAIRQHAGPGSQAADAVARFEALSASERRTLLDYVEAL
jgi:CxxC motif-containing protein (DUF1111 family)